MKLASFYITLLGLITLLLLGACSTTTTGSAVVIGADGRSTEPPPATLTPTAPAPEAVMTSAISLDNVGELEVIRTVNAHQSTVIALHFSQDNSTIYTFSADGVLKGWNVRDGSPLWEQQFFDTEGRSAIFDGGTRAVLGGDNSRVVVVDLTDRSIITEFLSSAPVLGLGIAGDTLAVGMFDGSTQVIDLNTMDELHRFEYGRANSGVTGIVFTSDASVLVTGHFDSSLLVWDLTSGERMERVTAPRGRVLSLTPTLDGSGFLSMGEDNAIRRFDFGETVDQVSFVGGHSRNVAQAAFSNDGQLIASTGQDSALRIWDANEQGQQVYEFEIEVGNQGLVWTRAVAFDRNNSLLAVGDDNGDLWFFGIPMSQ